jgi:two-component sensor histidine kinase
MQKLNREMLEKNKKIENLITEIHHRVKNNLQIISSILDMQLRNVDDLESKEAFKDAKSRINSMALVHQTLYEKENINNTNAQIYFSRLFKAITASYATKGKIITHQVQTDNIVLNIDTLIPMALIVNELLTNSYKYAFQAQQEGNIYFELSHHAPTGLFTLKYSDNGSGFPEGFDIKNSKGLGSLMSEQLTTQLFGNYEKKSNSHGLEYIFTFEGL